MDRAFVAQGVANRLFATENSIDRALADASQLMAEMLEARQTLRVSAVVGGEATAKVAEAIAALSQARTAVVAAHGELAGVRDRIGIRTKLIGEQLKTLEAKPQAGGEEIRRAG